MDIITIIYIMLALSVSSFFVMFAVYSAIEKNFRPVIVSIIITIILISIFLLIYNFDIHNIFKLVTILTIVSFIFLYFTPFGKTSDISVIKSDEKFDERDTMFARNDYKPDSKKYNEYYRINPDKKKIDDKLRSMPDLLERGGKYFDHNRAAYVKGLFEIEGLLANYTEGDINPQKTIINQHEATKLIKEKAIHLGAAEVGIVLLDQRWVYSNVGRGPEKWGAQIKNNHKFVVCYTVEMDYYKVSNAPDFDVIEESANQYINAQKISITLANFIRELGYSARAHVSGSNYQIIMPAVAYGAGLGELGRHGYLISKKYGSRVRLGAITTDIPLIADKPVMLGVQDFCKICRKCAHNCPSKAITEGKKQMVRGVEKWQLNIEQCYRYWRSMGTDCALCMKVCPFSHPNNVVHNVVRYGIKKSSIARRISLWGDNLFYGK